MPVLGLPGKTRRISRLILDLTNHDCAFPKYNAKETSATGGKLAKCSFYFPFKERRDYTLTVLIEMKSY